MIEHVFVLAARPEDKPPPPPPPNVSCASVFADKYWDGKEYKPLELNSLWEVKL